MSTIERVRELIEDADQVTRRDLLELVDTVTDLVALLGYLPQAREDRRAWLFYTLHQAGLRWSDVGRLADLSASQCSRVARRWSQGLKGPVRPAPVPGAHPMPSAPPEAPPAPSAPVVQWTEQAHPEISGPAQVLLDVLRDSPMALPEALTAEPGLLVLLPRELRVVAPWTRTDSRGRRGVWRRAHPITGEVLGQLDWRSPEVWADSGWMGLAGGRYLPAVADVALAMAGVDARLRELGFLPLGPSSPPG